MNKKLMLYFKDGLRDGTQCDICGKNISSGYATNATNRIRYIGASCNCINKPLKQRKDGKTTKNLTKCTIVADASITTDLGYLLVNGWAIDTKSDNSCTVSLKCNGHKQKVVKAINDHNLINGHMELYCPVCNIKLSTTDFTQVKSSINGTFGALHRQCFKKIK